MAPVSLVLVLSLSDYTASSRSMMLQTIAASLDPQLVVLKPRVLGQMPSTALLKLSEKHPVVEVEWESPGKAVLRAALKPHTWITRTLSFDRRDPLRERAKTIAFTVAAMMPQWQPAEPLAQFETPEVIPLSAGDFEAAEATQLAVEIPPSPVVEHIDALPQTTPKEDGVHGFIHASVVGMAPQLLGGGGIEVALCPLSRFCVGVAAWLGAGELPQVNRLDLRLQAIAHFRIVPWWNGRLGAALSVAGGALLVSLTRGLEHLSRWVGTGAIEAGPLLRWGVVDFTLTFGMTASGRTRIWVGDAQIFEIPLLSALGRLGFTLRW